MPNKRTKRTRNQLTNRKVVKLVAVQAYYKSKNLENMDLNSISSDSESDTNSIIEIDIESEDIQSL